MISIVVAYAENRVIGRDGTLPWRLPSDLRRFRELTWGHTVVSGRRTFESLPEAYRPLPERRNIVLSRQRGYAPAGAEAYPALESALSECVGECFVIGGAAVYAEALPLVDRIYATEIEASVEGDTWFPELPMGEWRNVERQPAFVEGGLKASFAVYERASA